MKKIILLLALLTSNVSFAQDCAIKLGLAGPMESYQKEILKILTDKHYTVVVNPPATGTTTEKWSEIVLTSAGDMQFKQSQYVHIVTKDGREVAETSIRVGWFSNKENQVLDYLEDIKACEQL